MSMFLPAGQPQVGTAKSVSSCTSCLQHLWMHDGATFLASSSAEAGTCLTALDTVSYTLLKSGRVGLEQWELWRGWRGYAPGGGVQFRG